MFEMLEYILQWYHLLNAKVYTEYLPAHRNQPEKPNKKKQNKTKNKRKPYFRKETYMYMVKPFLK